MFVVCGLSCVVWCVLFDVCGLLLVGDYSVLVVVFGFSLVFVAWCVVQLSCCLCGFSWPPLFCGLLIVVCCVLWFDFGCGGRLAYGWLFFVYR